MSYSLASAGIFLFALPVLIAQWIGVVKLASAGRSGEWWCMLVGAILTTIGPVLHMAAMFFLSTFSPTTEVFGMAMMAVGSLSTLGSLLFMIGFAIHATRISRLRGRVEELELMNLAQATELERLRDR